MAKIIEKARPVEARTDWTQHPLIGVALLVGGIVIAWVMAGAPAIIWTGWL